MKRFLPILLVILGFSGFLAAQILWQSRPTNAGQIDQEKGREQLFNSLFQELKLTTTKGPPIELKSLKSPLVVLNFWASWCVPCLKEFPSLVAFQRKYGDKVTVVGVNGDEEEPLPLVEKTAKKYELDFPQVLDPKSHISDRFLITSYPFTVIYHRGKVVHVAHKVQDFMDEGLLGKVNSALSSP
jgi:thiol-disulfide isomerase/thioredoxin